MKSFKMGFDKIFREKMRKLPSPVRVGLFVLLFFVIIVFGAYGPGYNSGDFIYGQF